MVQLDSKSLTGSYYIQSDGSYRISDFATDCSSTVSSIVDVNSNKIKELEMRVSCLENHIKAMEKFQDSKYKIVYGEH